ncbi:hypothetical protein BAG01nite_31650 [Brevibacillus agri]|uniref:Uncharacterized protein n=2 Tax=Brevibacillus agri TaxID=51101 RepID=A0A3M8APF4_9BACL|nr:MULTISPECIES: hypothetical protein [Brevibacillus]ELK40123.1 hypothetical protein D478_20971 [Brevibacillus agri BAB-2500]EJL40270.1 hypothetical protein PMI08_04541 [Brevibacillus sp. CF112]MDR9505929.1 hypothetical protein [Brevibacillus agri]MED1644217.1 hypothetical protein [Brevibacillus agri]MED1655485.1 hypothetical protein [Brevibacillus agri]
MSIIALTILLFFGFQYLLPIVTQEFLWNPEKMDDYRHFDSDTLSILILSYAFAFPIGLMVEGKIAKILKIIRFPKEDSAILKVLDIARENDGYVTVVDIATKSTLSLEEAQKILDDLQKKGHADLSVTKSGDILYYFPGFLKQDQIEDRG